MNRNNFYIFIPTRSRQRQQGVALFVVIVFVLLSMLLALWASRSSLFNEMLVGNDADYQRAFSAAQALVQDAELDIQGANSNGTTCTVDADDLKVCRRGIKEQFPIEEKEVGTLLADLDNLPATGPKCKHGMCLKRSDRPGKVDKQDFWNNSTASAGITLAQMTGTHASDGAPVGARYGQFTGAKLGNDNDPANPILRDRSAVNKGGWYWIEVMPYDSAAGNSGLIVGGSTNLALTLVPNVAYRITAVAYGQKSSTQVVLQETYVRQKRKD